MPNGLQDLDHMITGEGLIHFDGQAFPRMVVNDGQRSEFLPVEQRVRHEIHAPDLVGSRQLKALKAIGRTAPATRPLGSKIEAFLLVKTIDPLVIHTPALTANEHVYAPKPKPYPSRRDLMHTLLQRGVQSFGLGFVVPAGTALFAHCARTLDAHAVTVDEVANELFALRWPQSFFAAHPAT